MIARTVGFLAVFLFSAAASPEGTADRLSELERQVEQLQHRLSAVESKLQGSGAAPVAIRPGSSKDIRNWRQLRSGMTEQDVERLLGAPGKLDANEYFFTWYYNYPSGGHVRFNPKSRLVEAWDEPS